MCLAVGLGLVGCAQTFDATTLGVPATMASAASDTTGGVPFKVTSRAVFAAWGLFALSTPSLEKSLATQLVGAKEVTNLRIKARSRWSDILITGLTLGMIVPRAVTFEGVVRGQ